MIKKLLVAVTAVFLSACSSDDEKVDGTYDFDNEDDWRADSFSKTISTSGSRGVSIKDLCNNRYKISICKTTVFWQMDFADIIIVKGWAVFKNRLLKTCPPIL